MYINAFWLRLSTKRSILMYIQVICFQPLVSQWMNESSVCVIKNCPTDFSISQTGLRTCHKYLWIQWQKKLIDFAFTTLNCNRNEYLQSAMSVLYLSILMLWMQRKILNPNSSKQKDSLKLYTVIFSFVLFLF